MVGVTDKTTISINTAIDADGVYDHYADDIKINTDTIQNSAKLADIILHEGIHGITSKTIKQYLSDKSKLPVKVREACASLDTLRNTLKDKVKDTKEYKEYLSKQAKLKKKEKVVFTSDEASKFAPLDDLFEFVSYSLTRHETQKWLNGIEYKKDQTALDRFKDLIDKMIQALMGKSIDVKDNTALKAALNNSIVVLNAQELYESDATVSKPTFNTDLFTLNPEDFTEGDVIESLAVKGQTKKGVNKVFQEFPELSEIGTQEQYSTYLDTIFSDYINNFAYEAVEEFLVANKIIDRKC